MDPAALQHSCSPQTYNYMITTITDQRETGTNLTTDREQSTRSNATTARLPILVRLAEP